MPMSMSTTFGSSSRTLSIASSPEKQRRRTSSSGSAASTSGCPLGRSRDRRRRAPSRGRSCQLATFACRRLLRKPIGPGSTTSPSSGTGVRHDRVPRPGTESTRKVPDDLGALTHASSPTASRFAPGRHLQASNPTPSSSISRCSVPSTARRAPRPCGTRMARAVAHGFLHDSERSELDVVRKARSFAPRKSIGCSQVAHLRDVPAQRSMSPSSSSRADGARRASGPGSSPLPRRAPSPRRCARETYRQPEPAIRGGRCS